VSRARLMRRWAGFAIGAVASGAFVFWSSPPSLREQVPAAPAPASQPKEASAQQKQDRWQKAREQLQQAAEAAPDATDFDRIVWIADAASMIAARIGDRGEAQAIAEAVYDTARSFGLDPALVLAVIEVESGFDRFALSQAGARGLMQVMPFWKARIGDPEDNLFEIRTNIRYGCAILRYYLDREGSLTKALAAYNGSNRSTRYPWKVFAAMRRFRGEAR